MNANLKKLNSASLDDALAMTEHLVERSPWVTQQALTHRPFKSAENLAQALVQQILQQGWDARLELYNAHPELAVTPTVGQTMTPSSITEQSRLGFTQLPAERAQQLRDMNAQYFARFTYPFIIALHRIPDLNALFRIFEARLNANPIEEHATTVAEIASVVLSRTLRSFGDTASPPLVPLTSSLESHS